ELHRCAPGTQQDAYVVPQAELGLAAQLDRARDGHPTYQGTVAASQIAYLHTLRGGRDLDVAARDPSTTHDHVRLGTPDGGGEPAHEGHSLAVDRQAHAMMRGNAALEPA